MSFSLCIAFTYCTDDLVQGNEEGKFIDGHAAWYTVKKRSVYP